MERLYIFSHEASSDAEITTLQRLIYHIFTHPEFKLKNYFDEKLRIFKLGDPQKKASEADKKEATKIFSEYPANNYHGKASIRSDSKHFFTLFDHEKSIKIKQGIQLHALLERLNSADQLPQTLNALKAEGLVSTKELKILEDKVKALFQDQQFRDWFSKDWKVINEREILDKGETVKPDRVMIKDGKAVIVDYKREKYDKKHESQLNNYANKLKAMGYANVRKFLVYAEGLKIIEVTG